MKRRVSTAARQALCGFCVSSCGFMHWLVGSCGR
jgi:hypothetical protein